MEKGGNAGNQHYFPFPCFLTEKGMNCQSQVESSYYELHLTCDLQALLTLSPTTNFRLFQTERVCRQQVKFDENDRNFLQTSRKHWEKQKSPVRSMFFFSHSVFKRLLLQTLKPGLVWERVNLVEPKILLFGKEIKGPE